MGEIDENAMPLDQCISAYFYPQTEHPDEQIANDLVMISVCKDPDQLGRLCTRVFDHIDTN